MEDRLRAVELAVAGIDARLDAILPTLVTKSDLHEALHAQTWRIIGAAFAVAGLLLAGLKFMH